MGTTRFDLTGRVAIVTGGSQGIGRAIALALAEAGADIVVTARTPSTVESASDEIRALGRKALGVPADVTRGDDIARLVQRTRETFGRLDILVNNAGGGGRWAPLLDLTEQDFDDSMASSLKSVFLCSKAVAPTMLRQGRGAIINISSSMGKVPENTRHGTGLYGAAKAGVENITYAMAAEWGPAVRVNCVVPWWVPKKEQLAGQSPALLAARNKAFAMGRPGEPDDIAGAVVFLASGAASWITGSVLDISGGLISPNDIIRGLVAT